MKFKTLGKTGLKVSELGFGGIPIIPLGFDQGVAVVSRCFEKGLNFFDTANMYGDSEKKIGSALEAVRSQVILATKTLQRDAIGAAEHISLSLENLRTDWIDLYQFHSVSRLEDLKEILAPGGALEAVEKACAENKIRHFGLTSHDVVTALEACQTGLFATVQIPFNLIEREPAEELFAVASEHDMGIIAMKPFGGGLIDRIDLCVKFLQQYEAAVPIAGFSAREEVDEIVEMYLKPESLTRTDLAEIDRIRLELGRNFCHRCGYCDPCEQGVKIHQALIFRSAARRLAPAAAITWLKEAIQTIPLCNQCGECMDKCPYNLPIPDLLQDRLEYYLELGGRID